MHESNSGSLKDASHRIEKFRIELSPMEWIGHYSIVLFPLFLPVMHGYKALKHEPAINPISNEAIMLCFSLSAILIWLKYRELFGQRLYSSRTDEQFRDAALATAHKMKWDIEVLNNNILKATYSNPWIRRYDTRIHIQRKANHIEITCLNEPFLSLPDFLGTHKKHRMAFIEHYLLSKDTSNLNEKVLEEIQQKEHEIENESEWSFGNTVRRIIVYAFSLLFLGIAWAFWRFDGLNAGVFIFSILGSFYIILDLYTIRVRKKRKAINRS